MKHLILFTALFISLSVSAQTKQYKKMLEQYYDDFPTITIEEARKKLDDPNVIFLDAREITEYEVSHIQGAINVEYDHFAFRSVKYLPRDAEIIIYCSVGARSQEIGKRMVEEEFTNVKNLYGGLFHWSNSEYPMVDMHGKETTDIHGFSEEWGKWITKGNVVY